MENKNKYKICLLIYCVLTIVIFSVMWGPQILVLLGGWYFICFFVILLRSKKSLNNRGVVWAMLFYPVFVIFTKFLMKNDILPYVFLNRIEHFAFSFCLSFVIWSGTVGEKFAVRIILLLGLVNLVGLANEFLEYLIREINGFDSQYCCWVYQDTFIDLFINITASVIFCMFVGFKKVWVFVKNMLYCLR